MKVSNKKGFTIIELIIALALMGIIFVVLMTFFLFNNNTINKTNIKSELQSTGEIIINYMSKSFMEAKAIKSVEFDEEGKVKAIHLIGYNEDNISSFYIKDNTIIYKVKEGKDERERVIGENIEEVKIYNLDKEIENNKEVEIEIILSNKDVVYKLRNKFFFRNS